MREVVREILFRNDPIHIAATPDEYDPELDLSLGALDVARSSEELTARIHAIFVSMFDKQTAGSAERYRAIGDEIWRAAEDHT